ncbi:hypothetical protein PMAYCL1PPCAC_25987, partial [Pristionchus mayeri]
MCYSFTVPAADTNVVLIVQGMKMHLNKEFLAKHSPVFAAMFFGDFAEKGKNEIEINDEFYREFVDLLKVIHTDWVPIRDETVSHILKLADQFQVKSAINQAEYFLRTKKIHGGT